MVCLIRYTTPVRGDDAVEHLEWVTDSSWTKEQTLECFHARFPAAKLLSFDEIR
jgi:hypothetical protein